MKNIDIKKEFNKIFTNKGEVFEFFSPGRVNIIGEHIDYNGGLVFPCALDLGIYAIVRLRNDKKVNLVSLNFNKKISIELSDIQYKEEDNWGNYPKGVIKEFLNRDHKIGGFDILYYGNIPNGAGLSSSASIEVLTGVVLNKLFNCNENMIDIIKMCQGAENKFVGVNCGIMDQFAIAMGKKDFAILLDCNTLEYSYIPIKLNGVKIIISNTNKRRGLADSKYNERLTECGKALVALQTKLDIKHLCDLDLTSFEENKYLIKDSILLSRAEHVVRENIRTLMGVKALEDGNLKIFGELMNESHNSLRDLYQVTGKELDIMVDESRKIQGTIGSRMTGAGFGGCTISLVKEEAIDTFIKEVGINYELKTGLTPEFYIVNTSNGTEQIGIN